MKTARYLGALMAMTLIASACGSDSKSSGGDALESIRTGEPACGIPSF